jgi:chromosome segregation ATPase
MSELQAVLGIVVALFLLTVVGGGIWASFRSTDQEARIKRLQGERDDLLSRLNFIEPKLRTVEEQNSVLRELHNPAQQIAALREQEAQNHAKTYELLEAQSVTLKQIEESLPGRHS